MFKRDRFALYRAIPPTYSVLLTDARMYEQHFGLSRLPFSPAAETGEFFLSESTSEIIPRLLHSLQSPGGVAVLTAPDGAGKTTILRQVRQQLSLQGQAILIPGTSLQTVEDLYIGIRRGLRTLDGHSVPGQTGRWDIVEYLQRCTEFWGSIGLLIDDAHLLSNEIFSELLFLLEQRIDSGTLCRVLLGGNLSLEETLARPALSGLAQRIRTFTFLASFRPEEAVEYLRCWMQQTGGDLNRCFQTDAVQQIVDTADGNPRRLNLLADEALMLTCQRGEPQVTPSVVSDAVDQLRDLPHAWNVSVVADEPSLNDSQAVETGWRSVSDGVIEIGAGPEDGPLPAAASAAESVPATFETPDFPTDLQVELHPADDLLADDLPSLDELQDDCWNVTHDAPGADGTDDATPEFELADLQAVGESAVEIDEDLDRRLQNAAAVHDAAVTEDADAPFSTAVDENQEARSRELFVCESDGLLDGYRQWTPPGQWSFDPSICSELIRRGAAEISSSGQHTEQDANPQQTTENFSIVIPAPRDPLPVWPPETSGLSPQAPVEIKAEESGPGALPKTDGVDNRQRDSARHLSSPVINPPSAMETHAEMVEWRDGQLLAPVSTSTQTMREDLTDACATAEEKNSDGVVLKIADAASEDGPNEDADPEASSAGRMFTLPIDLSDVSGDCAPIARSVQEIQRDIDRLRDTQSSRHASGAPQPQQPATSSTASTDHVSDSPGAVEETVSAEVSEEMELRAPQLISQVRAMTTVAPSALRAAAGAESYHFAEEQEPMLSIADLPQGAEGPTPDPVSSRSGFRNLFTRLRRER